MLLLPCPSGRSGSTVEVPSPQSHLSRQMRPRTFPGQFAQPLDHPRRRVRLAATSLALVLTSVLGGALTGCAREQSAVDGPLLVFAAANMRDAMTDLARRHYAAGGDSAVLVFGSTGDLATQIANGAPADLFFAADSEAIEQLSAAGHLIERSRAFYAVGRLAVLARCTRADTAASADANSFGAMQQDGACPRLTLTDLATDSLRTIAIADPSHAPYGRAAQQALQRAGLWDAVRPKLVFGANISQAELFVTSGNADAGIVALSVLQENGSRDGQRHIPQHGNRHSKRAYTLIDASLHDALVQSVAIVSRSNRVPDAAAFIAYVQSEAGRDVLKRYGFELPTSGTTSGTTSARSR